MFLGGGEKRQLVEPMRGVQDVGDVGVFGEVSGWLLVQNVKADELAEGDSEVGAEGGRFGSGSDVGAGLVEQVVLAVASDEPALPVEHHVRVVQQEAVSGAVLRPLPTLHPLVVVHRYVHVVLPGCARDALQRLG